MQVLRYFWYLVLGLMGLAALTSTVEGYTLFGYEMFGMTRSLWRADLIVLGKAAACCAAMLEMWFVYIAGTCAFLFHHLELSAKKSEFLAATLLILFFITAKALGWFEGERKGGIVPDMASLYSALGLKPIFPIKQFMIHRGRCFYVGPFNEPFDVVYSDHIKPALERSGYSVFRADDIFSVGMIMNDIWESINTCELVVAEISGRNPNAFYEIGMAHAIGKKVILITQDLEDVPFDLRHYRIIPYSYTPKGCIALEQALSATVRVEAIPATVALPS